MYGYENHGEIFADSFSSVSMVSGGLFDKLEYVARVIRGKSEPFGGLQVGVYVYRTFKVKSSNCVET